MRAKSAEPSDEANSTPAIATTTDNDRATAIAEQIEFSPRACMAEFAFFLLVDSFGGSTVTWPR